MVQEQLRWGIMGCGLISGDFVQAMKLLPVGEHKVVAIGSKELERAEEFKKQNDLPDAKPYGSYEEFVNDPNIDVVYVGTRNNQHMNDVILCANAKKNILCEKPMGLSKAEVEKMFDAAEKNGVFLQEAFWSRFFPIYKNIRKIIDDGIIGEVQVVQADLGFPVLEKLERLHKPELGGGMALDLGCYLAQFALFAFGKDAKIEKIFATGWQKHDVDDTGCFVIKFEGHRLASFVFTGTAVLKCCALISGTKGRIEIPADMNSPEKYIVTIKDGDKEETKEYEQERPEADTNKFHFPTSNGLAFEADGVRKHLLSGCIDCCPEFKKDEALKVAEILESVRQQVGVM